MTDWFSISHRGEESVIFGQLHCRSLKHIKPKRYSEKYMSWSCPTWLPVNGCARCETQMPTISHDLWECNWVKFQRLTVLCAQDIFRRVQRVWFIPIQLLLLEPEMCMDKLVPKAWCERESEHEPQHVFFAPNALWRDQECLEGQRPLLQNLQSPRLRLNSMSLHYKLLSNLTFEPFALWPR